jgi:hypothetical protein
MVAHALHDMIAGTVLGARVRRNEAGDALAIP